MENQYGLLDSLRLTVVQEDYAGYDSALLAQHGISFMLEARSGRQAKTILFDTGQSARTVLNNLAVLGFDPGAIELIFLSHCHFDHSGGLAGILEATGRSRVAVVAHPAIYRPNFTIKPAFRPVGIGPANNREAVERAGGEFFLTSEPLPLLPGVLTTGEISKRVIYEQSPTLSLLTLDKGGMVPDLMVDDTSMVFILAQGLVIVTGCSHAGVVSIVKKAVELTGIENILALIGGFHLIDADDERIEKTVADLAAMNIGKVYTGHCTGIKAEAKLLFALGDSFVKLRTGLQLSF